MTPSQITAQLPVTKRATRGATWTVGAYGVQKVLAFGSSLVLTRLLVPDAFGLMTLVTILTAGLEMLSDTGTGPAIVQAKRGDAPEFLDTAWSIQIVRGFVLYLVALLLAHPIASIYRDPRLVPLLATACAGPAIRGFSAMRPQLLSRHVVLGRLTALDLTVQITTIAATVIIAWATRSVWALVLGSLLGDITRVCLSFTMLPGPPHHFRIDRSAASEIVVVGRWVLLSTALTYASSYLDRLLMGRLLSVRELGVYGIATMFVVAVTNLGRTVGIRVLFPVLAETARTSPHLLHRRLLRARLAWVAPTMITLWGLSLCGSWLIHLLYRPDFHAAGWMLRILAAGATVAILNQSSAVIWPALGEFRMATLLMGLQVTVLLVAMLVGHMTSGAVGFVIGCASAELLVYPVQALLLARRGYWQWRVDLGALGFSALFLAMGFGTTPLSMGQHVDIGIPPGIKSEINRPLLDRSPRSATRTCASANLHQSYNRSGVQ